MNINLKIIDTICSKCCKEILNKEVIITNNNETVQLQCSYTLNVIEVTDNSITVLLQNGSFVLVRNVYSYPFIISLPTDKCSTHIINITYTKLS
ncbi:MAG: hypothetical protein RSE41_08910 [Clostridia bacterium]